MKRDARNPVAQASGKSIAEPAAAMFELRVTGAAQAHRGPVIGGRVYG